MVGWDGPTVAHGPTPVLVNSCIRTQPRSFVCILPLVTFAPQGRAEQLQQKTHGPTAKIYGALQNKFLTLSVIKKWSWVKRLPAVFTRRKPMAQV